MCCFLHHRSLLRQGVVELTMWPCDNQHKALATALSEVGHSPLNATDSNASTENLATGLPSATPQLPHEECGMRPTGSSAVNPQSFDCPTLVLELDSYAHPVARPSCGCPW